MAQPRGVGTLYIVSTPIGNLEDITLRAVRILGEVDLVAAEDTRRTRVLLDHLGIRKPMVSCHDQNEGGRVPRLLEALRRGDDLALVSDAGTPLVADPGYRLVAAAAEAGVAVVPVPGASAPLALLAASGLPSDTFRFLGFLPARAAARRARIEAMQTSRDTQILFETAQRLPAALADLAAGLGRRRAVIGRELTKAHEEILRGDLVSLSEEIAARDSLRGEVVIAIARADDDDETALQDAETRLRQAVEDVRARIVEGESPSRAAREVAAERGVSRRLLYARVHGDSGQPEDKPED